MYEDCIPHGIPSTWEQQYYNNSKKERNLAEMNIGARNKRAKQLRTIVLRPNGYLNHVYKIKSV